MRYDKYNTGDIHWRWYATKGHWYPKVVDKSIDYLTQSGEKGLVLDIGSGDGLVDRLLINKGFQVIGIEPEEKGNVIARERVPEMTIIETTLEKAEIPEVDYLYSLNTIEHTEQPERFVDAMRKTRKFGLVITDNAEITPKDIYHTRSFTIQTLKDLFKDFKTKELDLGTKYYIGLYVKHNNSG